MDLVDFITQPEWINIEYWKYLSQFPVLVAGFLIALISTPLIGYIAKKYRVLNETKGEKKKTLNRHENEERRINPNPTPLLGGLAILIPLIAVIITVFGFTSTTIPILLALVLLIANGVLDDIYNLPATVQFGVQFLAAFLIAISTINLELIKIPFDGVITLDTYIFQAKDFLFPIQFLFPGDFLMIIWIMVVINAIKWVGGVDALMEGTLSIAFLLTYIIGIRTGTELVIVISLFSFGSLLGFIFYNFPPAKIFTGSTGKTAYGFLIAVLSLINDTKVAITIMIILLPLIDFAFVLLKRISMTKPKSLGDYLKLPINLMRMADTNHLHHQLLKIGLSVKQILLVEMSITLAVGIIAVLTTEAFRLVIVLMMGLVFMLMILLLHIYSNKREKKIMKDTKKPESPESRYSY